MERRAGRSSVAVVIVVWVAMPVSVHASGPLIHESGVTAGIAGVIGFTRAGGSKARNVSSKALVGGWCRVGVGAATGPASLHSSCGHWQSSSGC